MGLDGLRHTHKFTPPTAGCLVLPSHMLRDRLQPNPLEEVSCRHLSVLQTFVTCLADNNCLMQGNCLIFAVLDHQTIGLQAGIECKIVRRDSEIQRCLTFALQTFARTLLHFQNIPHLKAGCSCYQNETLHVFRIVNMCVCAILNHMVEWVTIVLSTHSTKPLWFLPFATQ